MLLHMRHLIKSVFQVRLLPPHLTCISDPPPRYVPKSLNSLHMRELLIGRYLQLDHSGRTGTGVKESSLVTEQERVHFILFTGKGSGSSFHFRSSSCELRTLSSPWRSGPSP